VRVTVKLFAGLRERAGWSSRELEDVERVGDVWSRLDLGEEPDGLLYAVNRAYADRGDGLADGDEVALIPPVSGGAMSGGATSGGAMPGGPFLLSPEPLDLQAVVREVQRDEAGAIATFVGTTRAESRGRTVLYLDYEAFEEMAEKMLRELGAALQGQHGLSAVAIHHRIGRVEIGQPSVAIAVSAPHRRAALAACAEAIDTLKETIPLWKKEVYEGGEEWIGKGS
jgi:molybdopterin synthase catalytic subunit/molybdopterin converting factor small subunit